MQFMNKKLILVPVASLALAGVIGGSTVAVSKHYNEYQNKQKQAQAESAKKASDAQAAKEAYTARLETAYTADRLECEKRGTYYVKLTAAQKYGQPKPGVCGPAVVK
jgi:hypothetical protein